MSYFSSGKFEAGAGVVLLVEAAVRVPRVDGDPAGGVGVLGGVSDEVDRDGEDVREGTRRSHQGTHTEGTNLKLFNFGHLISQRIFSVNKGWPRHFSRSLKCISLLQREKWLGHPLHLTKKLDLSYRFILQSKLISSLFGTSFQASF